MRFELLEPYIPMFVSGLAVTMQVTAGALLLAFALGALIAVGKVLPVGPLRAVLDFYTSIFRGVPLIVLLFIAYFATPQLTGYKIDMFTAAVITLGLNGSATVSETLRGGIEGVDAGQYDAARSVGLSYAKMMRLVVIPPGAPQRRARARQRGHHRAQELVARVDHRPHGHDVRRRERAGAHLPRVRAVYRDRRRVLRDRDGARGRKPQA